MPFDTFYNSWTIGLAILFISFLFFVYLPILVYNKKNCTLIILHSGLILICLCLIQDLFAIAQYLFNINPSLGIFGFILIGIISEYIIMFYYHNDIWVKLHDCGINSLVGILDYIRFAESNKKLVKLHQNNLQIPHAAVIIALRNKWNDDYIYADGFDLLVNYFENRGIPFRFYECHTPDEASLYISNPNSEKIWIFGHGQIDSLDFGNGGILRYCKLKNVEKKDFIGQFHCNSYAEQGFPSLADLILKPNGKKFVKWGYRCPHQNRIAIECCNKKEWDCNDFCEK